MSKLLTLLAGLSVLLAAQWLLLPTRIAWFGTAIAITATCCLLAWLVASPKTQWIVPTLYRGRPDANRIALTFDDGPDPVFTPQILEVLRLHGARATFFMVGHRVQAHQDLVRRVVAEGHMIGSHSYSHGKGFHFQRSRTMARDIHRGVLSIRAATGHTPLAFRPPMGLRVPGLHDALPHVPLPLTCFTWTARGVDALVRTPDQIVARLSSALEPGAILTLHDGAGLGGSADRAPTIAALRILLPRIAERGLRCVRLDELDFDEPWQAWLEPAPALAATGPACTTPAKPFDARSR